MSDATPPASSAPPLYTGELRRDIQIIPGDTDVNGLCTWLIFDPLADAYYKFDNMQYQIFSLLDHNYPLDEFMRKLEACGVAVTREEVMVSLQTLRSQCLIAPEYGFLEKMHAQQQAFSRKNLWRRIAAMVMFMRLPPVRVGAFFTSTAKIAATIFNPWTLYGLLLLSLCGYIMLLRNWNAAASMFVDSISWAGLVKYSLVIVVMKVVHELAHAYTATAFNVRVRGIGICFIMFFPRIYSDLTDAWRLPRMQRLKIDAAGIGMELIMGGIAALIWGVAPPGALHSTMFFIFSVTVLNTLLVNGNPFIRFDGYYILMDLLNIDNLMSRSNECVRNWWRKKFFGLPEPLNTLPAHTKILMFWFGVCAFFYMFFLYTSIIIIIYTMLTKVLAVFLMLLEVLTLFVFPVYKEMHFLLDKKNKIKLFRAYAVSGVILLSLLVLWVPLPWSVEMPCEIRPEKSFLVTVKEGGYIREGLDFRERQLKAGEILFDLDNPRLEWDLRRGKLDCAIDQIELDTLRTEKKSLPQSRIWFEKLKADQVTWQKTKARCENLSLRSPVNGSFVAWEKELKPGRWLPTGMILGEISEPQAKVIAYIPSSDIHKIKVGDAIKVTLHGSLWRLDGKITEVNMISAELLSSPLINFFGGKLPCRQKSESRTFVPVEPHYRVTASLDEPYFGLGGRTGTAAVRKYSSAGNAFFRYSLSLLRRELAF